MIPIFVSQTPDGYTFVRDFCRRRLVVGGGRVFGRVQLRAVAGILGVHHAVDVEFLDAGTFDVLAEVSGEDDLLEG